MSLWLSFESQPITAKTNKFEDLVIGLSLSCTGITNNISSFKNKFIIRDKMAFTF